jgi:hypothetical protein
MAEDLFAHAWARRDRAGEVADRMVELWNQHIADHPYSFSLVGLGNGVFILRVVEDVAPPQEFAVATGEWINHLRSALDYTIWAMAAHESGRVPPRGQAQIQYPIYDSRAGWERNLYRLAVLADRHRAMLLIMQPFSSDPDANYLGWINRIARSDRHRHLSRMTGYLAELQPALAAPSGCDVTLQWGERVISGGYADAVRFVVTPWKLDMEVEVNPRMGIDPDIEEWSRSPFWSRIPFPERLKLLHIFVGAEIAAYEYDATGFSRQQDALTETYRAECDTRNSPRRPPQTSRRKHVEWSQAVSPMRSSMREVAGEDFPPHGPGRPDARPDSRR